MSTADNEGQRIIGKFSVIVGPENTTPTDLVGLTVEDSLEIVPSKTSVALRTTSRQGDTSIDDISTAVAINFGLVQHVPEAWALALGETPVGQVVKLGGSPSIGRKYALRLTGQDVDGSAIQHNFPSCACAPSGSWNLVPNAHGIIPVNLVVQDHVDNDFMASMTKGGGDQDKTLSGGTFVRVLDTPQSYHRLLGEGSAADDLDTITAGDLEDGEILTLQIQSTASPITFIHAASGSQTLDLAKAEVADITLRALTDFIRLIYVLSTTEWQYVTHRATRAE